MEYVQFNVSIPYPREFVEYILIYIIMGSLVTVYQMCILCIHTRNFHRYRNTYSWWSDYAVFSISVTLWPWIVYEAIKFPLKGKS